MRPTDNKERAKAMKILEVSKSEIEKAIFDATGDKVTIRGALWSWSFDVDGMHYMTRNEIRVQFLSDMTLTDWVKSYQAIKQESDNLNQSMPEAKAE